jgi:hypothetical protein
MNVNKARYGVVAMLVLAAGCTHYDKVSDRPNQDVLPPKFARIALAFGIAS